MSANKSDLESTPNLPPDDKPEAVSLTETSPLFRWLDNFWYHYKWTVIAVAFFVSVAVIGIVQMASRPQYDSGVVIATHYRMDTVRRTAFNHLLDQICGDFDQNGTPSVNVRIYEIYSEEEYESFSSLFEAESDHFAINRSYNSDEYKSFNQYTMTGESSIYILSPYLYETLRASDRLLPLTEIYGDGELPLGARDDGYGIDIAQTVFYRYNAAAQDGLTDSAILCFHRPTVSGRTSKESVLENEKAFFRAINAMTVQDDDAPREPTLDTAENIN